MIKKKDKKHSRGKRGAISGQMFYWSYRCYRIDPFRTGWKCRNMFPALILDIPAVFVWPERSDRNGLQKYVDALLLGNRSDAVALEAAGAVQDIEMYHMERPGDVNIRVHARRFVDTLLLRDHFSVPLWGKLRFITDGATMVPSDFIAAMGAILGEEGRHLDPSKPWKLCTEKELHAMGINPSDVTSSMYQNRAPSVASPVVDGVPPREVEVHRIRHADYTDLMTRVIPDASQSYFARRIISRKGQQLWSATAYQIEGPWKIWKRESSELLALGLNI